MQTNLCPALQLVLRDQTGHREIELSLISRSENYSWLGWMKWEGENKTILFSRSENYSWLGWMRWDKEKKINLKENRD